MATVGFFEGRALEARAARERRRADGPWSEGDVAPIEIEETTRSGLLLKMRSAEIRRKLNANTVFFIRDYRGRPFYAMLCPISFLWLQEVAAILRDKTKFRVVTDADRVSEVVEELA